MRTPLREPLSALQKNLAECPAWPHARARVRGAVALVAVIASERVRTASTGCVQVRADSRGCDGAAQRLPVAHRRGTVVAGAGESGKSTVLKQVKNVYKIPFKEVELDAIRETIQFNALQSMNVLLKALVDLGIAVDSKTAKLVGTYTQSNTQLTPDSAHLIAKLWARKPIQAAWERRDAFW